MAPKIEKFVKIVNQPNDKSAGPMPPHG